LIYFLINGLNMRLIFAILCFSIVSYFSTFAQDNLSYQMKIVGKHDDEVLGVFVNEANTMVATCSLDETIKLWSLPDGKELRTLRGHLGQVNNVSFSGNDNG